MSHKTLVNGTVYEVDGGKTLIDGVAYSIDKGKTLVGGTAYEVGFGSPMLVVTLESDLPGEYSSTIMGIDYSIEDEPYGNISSAGTYELPLGTVLNFWIAPEKGRGSASIYVNDEWVASGSDGDKCSYYHTLTTNITISISVGSGYGQFYITEE